MDPGRGTRKCSRPVQSWGSICFGYGVVQNDTEAVKWWNKAVEQGYTDAQYNLGGMYALGRGVPKDHIKAYIWLSLPAEKGHQDAKKALLSLENKMSPAQIKTAQRDAEKVCQRLEKNIG
ncbi:tetratricopeptide repeat protein [uncultured Desulfuromusa sp.]|uniref:tetratricopeptide repeat protein n=1 Tax=uncultured Desulfuromusa sp. TaxID=219183 RepID=UPI00374A4F60